MLYRAAESAFTLQLTWIANAMKPRPPALLREHGNQRTLEAMHAHVSPMSASVCDLNGVRHQVWWIFRSWPSPLESTFRKEKGNRIQKVTHEEELVTH